jgi:hypothetical protein
MAVGVICGIGVSAASFTRLLGLQWRRLGVMLFLLTLNAMFSHDGVAQRAAWGCRRRDEAGRRVRGGHPNWPKDC